MTIKVPLFKTFSDEKDVEAVAKVLRRKTYWATGPEIQEFENKIAEFVGRKYALTFNSGTSALHALLLAHDVKDKEVIVPSFTFIATSNAVILAGGKPVFAESEHETFGLDAEDVRKRITPNTKAIMQLHYGGFPGKDTEKLREIADEHNILFIEDAAESLGSSINGKMIGNFGHSSMFSFCQNKVLAIGEGGILLTDDEKVFEKAKLIRSHGRVELNEDYFSSTKDNDYIEAGFNYRMPTICAALGLSQFDKIQEVISRRREKGQYLSKHLSQIKGIRIPLEFKDHFQVYQMYSILLENEATKDKLQEYLTKNGIMNKVYFLPVHLKTLYKRNYGCKEGDLPKTELLSSRILNIPLFPDISKEDLDYMIKIIKQFFDSIDSIN
ncbi:DegT/DnrJ/EryC1/StrS family aminotransferase [Candidatus Woesearchaeota archaeon]|jgi:perosamine synthetase|nr:DegT/DnrJ/EryC1/StrS family aminotransferase [Candidatus Woesearchaeota archaeon]